MYITLLKVTSILFVIGLIGIVLNRRNLIILIMSIELLLLAINLNFIIFSNLHHNLIGQIFALFVLTVAAADSAVGLAILVIYYRLRDTIDVKQVSNLLLG